MGCKEWVLSFWILINGFSFQSFKFFCSWDSYLFSSFSWTKSEIVILLQFTEFICIGGSLSICSGVCNCMVLFDGMVEVVVERRKKDERKERFEKGEFFEFDFKLRVKWSLKCWILIRVCAISANPTWHVKNTNGVKSEGPERRVLKTEGPHERYG